MIGRLGRIRRGVRRIDHADKRSPLLRLLQDGQLRADARGVMVAVQFDQQWRTLWKAQRFGYVDADQYLTDKGRAFLAKATPSDTHEVG